MLISFSLSNFKGFKKLEPIALKPLTVICGANNSGKSSIIQSLLLMKQSAIGNGNMSLDAGIQEPLILDGEESAFVHLGDWADVIYRHETDNKMSFRWQLNGDINVEINVDIESVNSQNQVGKKLRVSRFQFKELNKPVSFELIKEANHEKYQLKLTGLSLPDLLSLWIYKKQPSEIFDFKWTNTLFAQTVIDEIHFSDIRVTFNGLFPYMVAGDFVEQSYDILIKVKNDELNPKGEPKYLKFINETIAEVKNKKSHKLNLKKTVDLTGESYQLAIQYLREFWLSFRYLGPVRKAPRRHYVINKTGQTTIGSKGEYTSIVLAEEQEQTIPDYYKCIYDRKAIKKFEYRAEDRMVEALNGWLSFMQLPQLIPTPVIERTISQIKLDSTGVEVCLPDVGFGVSQILPVLVECLRTKSGETIILEQPEIHLHPSLQSKLADFLICMAKAGKKIIVETHSEHLIKRLYLRAAQDESDAIRNLLNTVFVQFDECQQTSVTQTIVINNEYGEIENWPVGFFDEDDSRELVAATLKKRMGKVRKK
jgi:predicted ATPase